MTKIIIKIIPTLTVLLMFSSLLMLLADTFIYPGIIKNHLLVDSSFIAGLSCIAAYFYYEYFPKNNLQKYTGRAISLMGLLFIPMVVLFSLFEILNYPNYVFSRYHIDPHSLQLIGIFLIMQFLLNKVYRENKGFLLKKFKNWIIVIFSLSFSIFLLGGNVKAQWSMIDDHEIVGFLGSDKRLSLLEIPKIIAQTEINHWGEAVRYRPSYYISRIAETIVWGGNPFLWYLARIIFLAIFLFVLVKIISDERSLLLGIAFAIFIMIPSYWSDIWAKLGPAEIYTVLGVSIYAYSFYRLTKANLIKNTSIISWFGLFVGGFIATGSKENFVIMALPSIFIIIRYFKARHLNIKLIFPFLHILYSIFIALGIVIAVSKTGQDVYMNSITLSNRWSLLVNNFVRTVAGFKIKEMLEIALILFLWQRGKIQIKDFILRAKGALYLVLFFIVTYLFQIIYYGGFIPSESRYSFPGIFVLHASFLVWFGLLFLFVKTVRNKLLSKAYYGTITCVSIILIFISVNQGFGKLLSSVYYNILATRDFTSRIENLSKLTKIYPKYPIILRSRSLTDYEPVYSLSRYFAFYNIQNAVYFDYEDENIKSRQGLGKYLSENLDSLSKTGMSGDRLYFKPFINQDFGSKCIDFKVSYLTISSGCIDVDNN